MNNSSDAYLKNIEWSEEDSCYIGTSPGLFIGGIHGDDQQQLFQELCELVEEIIQFLKKEGKPLPAATAYQTS